MINRSVAYLNARMPSGVSPTWPLALARIMLGLLWLGSLRWKLPPDFAASGHRSLREWLVLEVDHAAFGLYGSLIESVVLPNFTVFAWLVFLAELGVGLALLLGVGTRPAAIVGLLMSINLLVGLLEVPGEWPWSYILMSMWHGTILVSGAGSLWAITSLTSSPSLSKRSSLWERQPQH